MNLFNTVGLTEMILPTTAWCGLLPLLAALLSSVSLSAGKADKCETCRKIATSFKEVSIDSMFSHYSIYIVTIFLCSSLLNFATQNYQMPCLWISYIFAISKKAVIHTVSCACTCYSHMNLITAQIVIRFHIDKINS